MIYYRQLKAIFLFVDGVGLAGPSSRNPLNPEVCPTLWRLIERHGKPVDACLGIPGAPQSATGQATMFTGVNCAQAMGRHCEGFPPAALREIVSRDNLFLSLKRSGRRVRFADAYLADSADEVAARRFKSVTTVMALTVPESIATVADLMSDDALLQDLTRETIQDRYPDVPVVSPERAAEHLFRIACANDLTLYEFFQTDVAGHSLSDERACSVLRVYDRFLASLVRYTAAAGVTVVLTSDHGNVEDLGERGHTRNPVPFVAFGPGEARMRERVMSLVDVTPAVVAAFGAAGGGER